MPAHYSNIKRMPLMELIRGFKPLTEIERAFATEKHLELKRESLCFQALNPGPIEYQRGRSFCETVATPCKLPRKELSSNEKREERRRYRREYYRKWRGVPKALRQLP